MTSVFASRRRAEEFSSLVESPSAGVSRDATLEEFLALVESLRAVPSPEPRPEFVGSLREQLMAAADTLLVPVDSSRLAMPARSARRDRRIAAVVGGLAVVGAGTSMAVAAQGALPGEMLYPLKRAIEVAEADAATTPSAQAHTLLDSATRRLTEVEALGREGELSNDDLVVSSSFVDFAEQAREGSDVILDDYASSGDRALVRDLRDFTGSSMATLAALEDSVPESARDELQAAVDAVTRIDAQAREACPTCGGAGVQQIPQVLLSSATSSAPVVVIPGATVDAWQGSRERGGNGNGNGGDTAPATDHDGGSQGGDENVSTDPVVTAPGGGGGTTGGTTGGGATDPLTDAADALTGGDNPTASNDGTQGAGDKVKDTVKDTVKDAGNAIDDTVDGLGGTLTGN